MWKLLIPIILLVIVLLFQLQVRESFVTAKGTDASGNAIDASGNPVKNVASSTITLTLADLLSLFKTSPGIPATTSTGGGSTSTMFYSSTSTSPSASTSSSLPSSLAGATTALPPSSLGKVGGSTVDGITTTNLAGSPYIPSQPIPSQAPCSDAAAQGVEFQNSLQDYIKKDEIPCYGCSL